MEYKSKESCFCVNYIECKLSRMTQQRLVILLKGIKLNKGETSVKY